MVYLGLTPGTLTPQQVHHVELDELDVGLGLSLRILGTHSHQFAQQHVQEDEQVGLQRLA